MTPPIVSYGWRISSGHGSWPKRKIKWLPVKLLVTVMATTRSHERWWFRVLVSYQWSGNVTSRRSDEYILTK